MTRVMSQLSIEAYFTAVQPRLTEREKWVLDAVDLLGEASAETVADHYGVGVNVISGRFTGLKKKQLIHPTVRKMTKSGSMAQFYSIHKESEYGDAY